MALAPVLPPNNYSLSVFFSNSNWNAVIDSIYYHLLQNFPFELNSSFCLTGRAAAIHQGFIAPSECNNVIFVTNDEDIYSFVVNDLPGLVPNNGVIKFKERALFYFEGLNIEIWYDASDPDILLYNNFYVQQSASINPILL